jgi:hypothetical protein
MFIDDEWFPSIAWIPDPWGKPRGEKITRNWGSRQRFLGSRDYSKLKNLGASFLLRLRLRSS